MQDKEVESKKRGYQDTALLDIISDIKFRWPILLLLFGHSSLHGWKDKIIFNCFGEHPSRSRWLKRAGLHTVLLVLARSRNSLYRGEPCSRYFSCSYLRAKILSIVYRSKTTLRLRENLTFLILLKHTAKLTWNWLNSYEANVFNWKSLANLNPMENRILKFTSRVNINKNI